MTDADYIKPRLRRWKDFLSAAGGTPHRNDTLPDTDRKCVDALGGTSRSNDTFYQSARKVYVLSGATVPCCNLPEEPVKWTPRPPANGCWKSRGCTCIS